MQRRQLLEGDWNVADGAAFSEFRKRSRCRAFRYPTRLEKVQEAVIMGIWILVQFIGLTVDPAYETLICYRVPCLSKHR